jgi:mono/diheme cytochrome c family protein
MAFDPAPLRPLAIRSMPIMIRHLILSGIAAAVLLAAQFSLHAQPLAGDAASGRQVATRLCSSCHRVLPMTFSDDADPPSFQSVADLPSTTGYSLNVFLHSNHNNMPDLILSTSESADVIAYILSLKKK